MQGSVRFVGLKHNGPGTCRHCGSEVPADSIWAHLAWTCTYACGQGDVEIVSTQHLAYYAKDGVSDCPMLWLRGLIPFCVTFDCTTAPNDDVYSCDCADFDFRSSHQFCDLPFRLPQGSAVASDGGGGPDSKDSTLR